MMKWLKNMLGIVILIMAVNTGATAREATLQEKIAGLYIAYFDRAPDASGLSYWTGRGEEAAAEDGNISQVLKELSYGFSLHPSFVRTYGGMDNRQFVEAIYRNTLGREGDEQGINWWTGLLNDGLSRSDFVAIFVESVLTFDRNDPQYHLECCPLSEEELNAAQLRQELLVNKVTVALAFTLELNDMTTVTDEEGNPLPPYETVEDHPAYQASIVIVSNVTEDPATVEEALKLLHEAELEADPIEAIILGGRIMENPYQIRMLPLEPIYNPGDTLEIRIAWEQNGSGESASVYVAIEDPQGRQYFLDSNGSEHESPVILEKFTVGSRRASTHMLLEYLWNPSGEIVQGRYRIRVWVTDQNASAYDDPFHLLAPEMEKDFEVTSHYIPITYGSWDGRVRTFRHVSNDEGIWIIYNDRKSASEISRLYAMKLAYDGRTLIAPFPFSGEVYLSTQGATPCSSIFAAFPRSDGFAVVSREKNSAISSNRPYELWYRAFDDRGLPDTEILLEDRLDYDSSYRYLWGSAIPDGALIVGWSDGQLYLWVIEGRNVRRVTLGDPFDPYRVSSACETFYKAVYDDKTQRLLIIYGSEEGSVWFLRVTVQGEIEQKREISADLSALIDLQRFLSLPDVGWPDDFRSCSYGYCFISYNASVTESGDAWIFGIDENASRIVVVPIRGVGNALATYGSSTFDTYLDGDGLFHWFGRTGSTDYKYARFDLEGNVTLPPTSLWHRPGTSGRPFVSETPEGIPYVLFAHYDYLQPAEIKMAFLGYDFPPGHADLGVSSVHIHQQPAPYAILGGETTVMIDLCNRGENLSEAARFTLFYLETNMTLEISGGQEAGECREVNVSIQQPDFLTDIPVISGILESGDYPENNRVESRIYFPPLTPVYPKNSRRFHWELIDAVDGTPVGRASVIYDLNNTLTVSGIRHNVRFNVSSDENGVFETVLPVGSYRFSIYKTGYPGMVFPMIIDENTSQYGGSFELIPPGSLEFLFHGTDDLPLHPAPQSISVSLQHDPDETLPEWESYHYDLRGDEKSVNGGNLMPGAYSGSVRAFGYEEQQIDSTVVGGETSRIDISLVPLPRGQLSGKILSEGTTVAGVTIRIVDTGIETVTESEGNFTLSDLPISPGTSYRLEISKDGYRTTFVNFEMLESALDLGEVTLPKIYSRTLAMPRCRYAAWVQDAEWSFQEEYEIRTIYGVWDLEGKLHYQQVEGSDEVDIDQLSIRIDAWRWNYWDLDGHVIDAFLDTVTGVLADSFDYLKYLLEIKEAKDKAETPKNLLVTKQELSDPMGTVEGAVVDCGDPDALVGLDEYAIPTREDQTVVRVDDLRIYDGETQLYSMHDKVGWLQYFSDEYTGEWMELPVLLSRPLDSLDGLKIRLYLRIENGLYQSAPLDLVGSDRLYIEWRYRDGRLQWSGYLLSPSDYPVFVE